MELLLTRRWLSDTTTIGELSINGKVECFTLEDKYRPAGEAKVPKKTAIPNGRYRVQRTYSPKFDRMLPLLWNVALPDGRLLVQNEGKTFEGIRIHPGNKEPDTDGCVLPGKVRAIDRVEFSVAAFEVVDAQIAAAEDAHEQVWITVQLAGADERAVC